MTKEEVIEDALNDFHHEIDELIEFRQKKYQKYLNSNYLVSDRTDCPEDEDNPLEKVNCPVCDSKIYKHVNHEVPCPRCGGNLMICDIICCD